MLYLRLQPFYPSKSPSHEPLHAILRDNTTSRFIDKQSNTKDGRAPSATVKAQSFLVEWLIASPLVLAKIPQFTITQASLNYTAKYIYNSDSWNTHRIDHIVHYEGQVCYHT